MLYKTYADADTEAKKIAKELAAAKKINSKKKTQPLTDSKQREKEKNISEEPKQAAKGTEQPS